MIRLRLGSPRIPLTLTALLALAACGGRKPYAIDLMPAPEVYEEGVVDPFVDAAHTSPESFRGIPYVTDRDTIIPGDKKATFYASRRSGGLLRMGVADVRLGDGKEEIDWEQARQISLLKNRAGSYPLQVEGVEEFGVLDRSVTVFQDESLIDPEPGQEFLDLIEFYMESSDKKDIYIYVHGFKVNFDNPVLVASELWHFMGYKGAMIAFSWPSTPSLTAYAADSETAVSSGRSLRTLIEFLGERTSAERIHVIGYSAGTRVVTTALHQLALANGAALKGREEADLAAQSAEVRRRAIPKLKLENVILIGSDVDRGLFGGMLLDGITLVTQNFTLYTSTDDGALGMARWFFSQNRVGQTTDFAEMQPSVARLFRNSPQFHLIDVTDAQGATDGSGHSYFRTSPWVSSDVLMTMMHGLAPEQRGLIRDPKSPIWQFPDNYVEELRAVLADIYPQLREPVASSEPVPPGVR